MYKRIVYLILALILLTSSHGLVASIGNARMVLYPELINGETIEINKSIYVQNMNNESVQIDLFTEGNFSTYVEVLDQSFILDINESKDARFILTVNELGRVDGKIFVRFSSLKNDTVPTYNLTQEINRTDRGGFGLASNIIIIPKQKEVNNSIENESIDIEINETNHMNESIVENEGDNKKNSFPMVPLLIIIGVAAVLAVFIVVGGRTEGKK
jgi:hypothetical protein